MQVKQGYACANQLLNPTAFKGQTEGSCQEG